MLGVDAIVDAALRIVDSEGVDAVSMRRVAAEFSTGPASLYAHVANKDQLLTLVHDRIVDEIEIPDCDTWQELLRAGSHTIRDTYRRHNDAARLSFGFVPEGTKALDYTERLMELMLAAGVPAQVAAWTLDVVSLYVAADAYEGWLLGQRFDDGSGRDPEQLGHEYFAGVAERFATLPAGRYPVLLANLGAMMAGTGDERFDFGIEMLIAGVAAQASPDRD
ncbi:transcriptional regulator [Nakamurella endophytica]|uniref:Transcriptional regulator n=1 Tax=Nakamurella endophytica TaxID=1748367 RepID=A0A917SUY6_9ACTN|nr:transcriptional regulator [Nakamurella endophytica]